MSAFEGLVLWRIQRKRRFLRPADAKKYNFTPRANLEIMDVFLFDHALNLLEAWNCHSSTVADGYQVGSAEN